MIQALAPILKIFIFIAIGSLFRKSGILDRRELGGVHKIFLYLGLPSVLFLSFSKISLGFSFIPIILAVFFLNLICFLAGLGFNRITGGKNRVLAVYSSTLNFSMIGVIFYQAVFGTENLHHFTMLGVGNEIFVWCVLMLLVEVLFGHEDGSKKFSAGFLKSPVIWGILAGCLISVLRIDLESIDNIVVRGLYMTIEGCAAITGPLVLIYVGYNIVINREQVKKSVLFILFRLIVFLIAGYGIKFLVLDHFIPPSEYYNAAWFLLLILSPIYSISAAIGPHLSTDELVVFSNTTVMHTLAALIIFSVYYLVVIV